MLLVFLSSIAGLEKPFFWGIPTGSFVNGLLFWVFTHLWMSTLKKQMKNYGFKKNAIRIVIIMGLSFAIAKELFSFRNYSNDFTVYFNLIFDCIGILFGFLSFRILYSKCY